MTLSELYKDIGGDYNDILSRFGSDAFIDRFIKKFAVEESYNKMCAAMEAQDWDNAFLYCHTLKGLCLNMSFTSLGTVVSKLTEELRPKLGHYTPELYEDVKASYKHVITKINEYIAG